ncbi:MAG: Tfx family DNA-binding protein [Thermoplasmata archaeon]|nr:Tfx family DNA-binding protein [Thermoplasmata archaeon]
MARESLLTPEQIKVLKLLREGKSRKEIAEILGTSVSNVYMIEKRALRNVEIAKRTLQQYLEIQGEVTMRVPAGVPLREIPELVVEEANKYGVKLKETTSDILYDLIKELGDVDNTPVEVEIRILHDGRILMRPSSGR